MDADDAYEGLIVELKDELQPPLSNGTSRILEIDGEEAVLRWGLGHDDQTRVPFHNLQPLS